MKLALVSLLVPFAALFSAPAQAEYGIGGGGINSSSGSGMYRITGVGGTYSPSTFPSAVTPYGRGGFESVGNSAGQINTRPAYITVVGNTIVTGVGGITNTTSYGASNQISRYGYGGVETNSQANLQNNTIGRNGINYGGSGYQFVAPPPR
jgi:hypothetical protein